ncbi:metal ABC transporter permease [Archaeoglobus neptunius]|uniref:metal ABC transporter permease n=1 Tax=Archaeoglobus neptunius TaxID=2798580 RepID=UPI00192864E5|nr:metal ABC transporter permease [Archaeoglobus neptunius]
MDELILRAIIAAVLISINAAVAGSLTVFRRASFLVAGSAHSALAGVAAALFLNSIGFGVHYFIFAMIAAVFSAYLTARAARRGDVNTGIAAAFSLSMAVAVIFISMTRNSAANAWQFLFGDILLLTQEDFVILAVSTVLIVITVSFLYYKFLFISFDPLGAEAAGINVYFYDFVLIALISASVVTALKAVGAILVFSIFVAPSSAARILGKSTGSVYTITFVIALVSLYAGIATSYYLTLPSGAVAAALASTVYFAVAWKS